MKKNKVIIEISGGNIEEVITLYPSEVTIIDWDNIEAGDDMGRLDNPHCNGNAEEFNEHLDAYRERIGRVIKMRPLKLEFDL